MEVFLPTHKKSVAILYCALIIKPTDLNDTNGRKYLDNQSPEQTSPYWKISFSPQVIKISWRSIRGREFTGLD